MRTKATAAASMALHGNWDTLTLDHAHLDQIAAIIRLGSRPLDPGTIARILADSLLNQAMPGHSARVKKYDHRCNYEEGDRVYMDNRYGRSFATITKIIRQPDQAFCDKAFLEFDDEEYRARWEEERSTPYFAIHSGRTKIEPTYVDADNPSRTVQGPFLTPGVLDSLTAKVEETLRANPRFQQTDEGWLIAAPARGLARNHIASMPGGRTENNGSAQGPLPQGFYKAPLLEVIDKMGEATIDEIKKNIQARLTLGPADWEMDKTGKIVWIHRLHAAIKHLKRVRAIDSPRREVYRRVGEGDEIA